MKKLMLLAVFVLAGCDKNPVGTQSTNNVDIRVDFLFENDGCKIYRFEDGGYSRYYVVCRDGSGQTAFSDPHTTGKTTYEVPQNIMTINQP